MSESAFFAPVCLQRSLPAVVARGCHHENVWSHGRGTDGVHENLKQCIVYPSLHFKQSAACRLRVHTDGMGVDTIVYRRPLCIFYFEHSLCCISQQAGARIESELIPALIFTSVGVALLFRSPFYMLFFNYFPLFVPLSFVFHRHTTLKVTTSFDKGPQETPFISLAKAR